MNWPQHQNPHDGRKAQAPYNFVPLPEKVKWAGEIPGFDAYHSGRYTGWLDCTLTTSSPLYIRAGLTPEQAQTGAQAKDQPDFFYTDPHTKAPVIPGSSLRGMLRAMVEIVSYSKVQPVSDATKISFRAVAAATSDPLAQPYQNALGKYGRNVKAGYLKKQGQQWVIEPARKPSDSGMAESGYYLKVKDKHIPAGAVPSLIRFRKRGYKPQYHDVRFKTERRQGKNGPYTTVEISNEDTNATHNGVLVCSGNMAESGNDASSKRKNYALVLERAPGNRVIPIDKQTVQDYIDTLTDFQKQPPFDKHWGCLVEGRPIFYVERSGKAVAFGHCPNFRIPAWLHGSKPKRAAMPCDFVPEALRDPNQTDLAEAIFGYVEPEKQDARPVARAGRVFVTDATLLPGQGSVWLSANPITLKVLASPKPTTFQHYLVQTAPNNKKNLRHYGSPTPAETVIRGHKLYWHKDNVPADYIQEDGEIKEDDKQHTEIKPLRSGVRFHFHIYFEDLDDVELGVLLWLLNVAADDEYRFKLGMGKPWGLGAAKITSALHITDRAARYTTLFDDYSWASGEIADGQKIRRQAVAAFEKWILNDGILNPGDAKKLKDVPRIQMLLFLLSWPGPDRAETRYLHIEPDNEYKDRPVLPDPRGVVGATGPVGRAVSSPTSPKPTRPVPKPKPVVPPLPQTVSDPKSVAEIKEGDLLKGKVVAVDANRVRLNFGIEATGTMGLVRLDSLVRTDNYFKETYPNIAERTAARIFKEGHLDEDLDQTQMLVRVRKIVEQHGKVSIKVDFVKWLAD